MPNPDKLQYEIFAVVILNFAVLVYAVYVIANPVQPSVVKECVCVEQLPE